MKRRTRGLLVYHVRFSSRISVVHVCVSVCRTSVEASGMPRRISSSSVSGLLLVRCFLKQLLKFEFERLV